MWPQLTLSPLCVQTTSSVNVTVNVTAQSTVMTWNYFNCTYAEGSVRAYRIGVVIGGRM